MTAGTAQSRYTLTRAKRAALVCDDLEAVSAVTWRRLVEDGLGRFGTRPDGVQPRSLTMVGFQEQQRLRALRRGAPKRITGESVTRTIRLPRSLLRALEAQAIAEQTRWGDVARRVLSANMEAIALGMQVVEKREAREAAECPRCGNGGGLVCGYCLFGKERSDGE